MCSLKIFYAKNKKINTYEINKYKEIKQISLVFFHGDFAVDREEVKERCVGVKFEINTKINFDGFI